MKIVVLDGYCLNPGDLSWKEIEEFGDVTVYDRTAPSEVLERCKGAEVLFTNKTFLNADTLSKLHDLKYIGILATGYNVVDVEAAYKLGIVVTNVPAYSTDSVAQMVFALLLNITNRVAHYAREDREGKWRKSLDFCYWDTPLIELKDKVMGIVGLGHIGMAVANIAKAFGLNIMAVTSKSHDELPNWIRKVEMEQLFKESDVISLHCPLNDDTKELINEKRLAMMKPSAILINTSRGGVIDEQALADALNDGRIAAAGLDVLSTEPPKADNPLLKAKNCYVTPHIAWATKEARQRMMDIIANNLKSFLDGNIINQVK